jgi:bis(5'-adenosyl)-triphosphatase
VNLKPLVPGHVLVVPRRVVPRYEGLTAEEGLDLWAGVLAVQGILTKALLLQQQEQEQEQEQQQQGGGGGGVEFDIGMQDGPIAGQSVPHVHVHILPK